MFFPAADCIVQTIPHVDYEWDGFDKSKLDSTYINDKIYIIMT